MKRLVFALALVAASPAAAFEFKQGGYLCNPQVPYSTCYEIARREAAITASYATGPDGVSTSSMRLLAGATGATTTLLYQDVSAVGSNQTNTDSVWVKSNTGASQTFQLVLSQNGVGNHFSGDLTATTTWARVSFSQLFGAGGTTTRIGFVSSTTGSALDIQIFGFQLENNASFATSYIPTAASSVTRAADVVQFTGAALAALQGSAGSAIVQAISATNSAPAALTNVIRGIQYILYRDTSNKVGTSNGVVNLLTAASPVWNAAYRLGLAWSASGRSVTYSSSAVATDANTASNGGTLYLGSSNGSGVENGWYQSFAIYNQRLSDATLQAKSVVGASYAANDNGVRFAFANDNVPTFWRLAL